MDNRVSIHSDGKCVYITARVVAHKFGLLLLSIFNLILVFGFFYLMSLPDDGYLKTKLFLLILGGPIYIFTLGRYTAWNFWGEERIMISAQAINFQYSYGFIELKPKTIMVKELSVRLIQTKIRKGVVYGDFILFDYDDNNLPVEIFESAVEIRMDDLENLEKLIGQLYYNKDFSETTFIPYSLN